MGSRVALPAKLTEIAFNVRYGRFARHFSGSRAVDDATSLTSALGVFALRHHFGEGWAAELQLPVGLVEYSAGDEAPTGRISGIGDLQLAGRFDFSALWGAGGYRPSLTLRLGGRLPSGKQETITVEGVPPSLLGIGTGTFGLFAGLDFTKFVRRALALRAMVSVTQPLSRSEEGVGFGTLLGYGAGATVLPFSDLTATLQINAIHRGMSERDDVGDLLNSGGVWVAAELSAGYRVSTLVSVAAAARVPFFADVNGRQVSETFTLVGSLVFRFGSDEHAHDHGEGHAHGETHAHEEGHAYAPHDLPASEGDATGGDVLDLAVGGASFSAGDAVVPGKVTVVDFWAKWCAPCVAIDAVLRRLAAAHPDLAVRRAEVLDFSSPVAEAHLEDGAGLPVLWLIDREGRRKETLMGVEAPEVERKVLELLGR